MYERYWLVKVNNNGFESKFLVFGTENGMREYLTSELGYMPGYTGATEAEVAAARLIGIKAYIV